MANAVHMHQKQELLCLDHGDWAGVRDALMCQAEMLQAQGDADGAIRLYAEMKWLCREYKDARALPISLRCQAQILTMLAALDDAGTLPGLGSR